MLNGPIKLKALVLTMILSKELSFRLGQLSSVCPLSPATEHGGEDSCSDSSHRHSPKYTYTHIKTSAKQKVLGEEEYSYNKAEGDVCDI